MNAQNTDNQDQQYAVSPSLRWRLVLLVRGFEPLEACALTALRARVEEGTLGGFADGESTAASHDPQGGAGKMPELGRLN